MIKGIQIIGTQRSGSNLLRVMLNQLSEVAAPHPPHILKTFNPLLHLYGDLKDTDNFTCLAEDICRFVEENPVPWGIRLSPFEIVQRCRFNSLPEIFRVIYESYASANNARYWICKSMQNVHFADQLEMAGINPVYIHLYRDGRDVASSFKKALVGEKHSYFIARNWVRDQEACLNIKEKISPRRFISVRYEDLIQNPANTLKGICGQLGVNYTDEALSFFRSGESIRTAQSGAMWSNVAKPIMKSNSQKFLKELSREELCIFESIAGDTLRKLGFPITSRAQDLHPHFSDEQIHEFRLINEKLKYQALCQTSVEDLEKRKGQKNLIQRITTRQSVAHYENLV